MTELEAMLCRIGNEQEASDGQPFPFQCLDAESVLVNELRIRGFVRQQWTGPGSAIVRMLDGSTTFNALSLTDTGVRQWKVLTRPRVDP